MYIRKQAGWRVDLMEYSTTIIAFTLSHTYELFKKFVFRFNVTLLNQINQDIQTIYRVSITTYISK